MFDFGYKNMDKKRKKQKNRMIVIENKRPTSTKMQAYIPFIK